jgi:hypothetical protein
MSLPKSEWLKEAQTLAIGMTQRFYHGAEGRPNMVVRNMPDRYTAYCHSCHEGAVFFKEQVKHSATVTVEDKESYYIYTPMTVADRRRVTILLQEKGMCSDYLRQFKLSIHDGKRLMFHTPDQVIGRDLTGHSKAKWLTYSGTRAYIRCREWSIDDALYVILTEDLFSAAKWDYFTPDNYLGISLCGTELGTLLSALLNNTHVIVILSLDGDAAGDAGTAKIKRTLDILGIRNLTRQPPRNHDPKDMPEAWFKEQLL